MTIRVRSRPGEEYWKSKSPPLTRHGGGGLKRVCDASTALIVGSWFDRRLIAIKAASSSDGTGPTRISSTRSAESALQRSEAYLAEAQKLSRTGSLGWNVSKGEIFWSQETFRIFEYEPGTNATLKMVLDRVHPDDRALVEGAIDRAITHKEVFDIEHRLQMPDGSVKHLHVVAHALVDEPQNLQFAGAVMDVTAAKATERALRHSETRYQNLF